jgi:hypothetical protein
VVIIPDTGHDLALFTTTPLTDTIMIGWSLSGGRAITPALRSTVHTRQFCFRWLRTGRHFSWSNALPAGKLAAVSWDEALVPRTKINKWRFRRWGAWGSNPEPTD